MKENNNDNDDNNNDIKRSSNIKDIINYFNDSDNRNSMPKKEIINDVNKNKNNLSKIYQNIINNKEKKQNINEKIEKNNEKNISKNYNENNIKKINENIHYHEIIKNKLINLKQNTILFLDNIKKEVNQKYSFFSDNILNWMKKWDKRLSKILYDKEINDNILEYINKLCFDKIKQLFDMHENIFNCIKDHFTLLNSFLGANDLMEFNCPLEEFILKNSNLIINSFFLSKINMQSLCLSKFLYNKDLAEIFEKYYSKREKDMLFKSIVLKKKSTISRSNFLNINKLKIKAMSMDELNKLYIKISEGQGKNESVSNKIKNITISNMKCNSSSIEDLSKMNYPLLEKIKIKNCLIPYESKFVSAFISQTTNLKTVKLESINLTNKSLYKFILFISKNKSLLDSIQCMSFKDNRLYSINFEYLAKIGVNFTNLELFDLSSNDIYNFASQNFLVLPKLKLLELSNNNFNNNLLFESVRKSKSKNLINFMVFMSQNIFVYNVKDNNEKYIKYINENLVNFNYKIKSINLSLLYNKDNCEELTKLFFSPTINFSLIELNLSYCGLNDTVFYSFLKNNYYLLNLKKVNLSYNLFTIKFFSVCLNINNDAEYILLEKIKDIDLSYNNIKYQANNDLSKIYKYIDKHSYLKKIKLQNNELLNIFQNNTDNNKENKNDIEQIINLCIKRNIKFVVG